MALGGLCVAALLASCGGGGGEDERAVKRQALAAGGAEPVHKTLAEPSKAVWGPVINLPLVPASAAGLPNGKILLWSGIDRFRNSVSYSPAQTYFVEYDPATGQLTERVVAETGHEMFCTGTTNLADGRLLINGGSNAAHTSIFDPATSTWTRGADMTIPRAYQANTLLPDGSVLTLGGSWNGGIGNRNAEIWTAAGGWRALPGVPVQPMQSDPNVVATFWLEDSHMWLIPTGNGKVLQAGPSERMHWIDTRGNGSYAFAGTRGDDGYATQGTTVMFDAGRVLKTGGGSGSMRSNAFLIDTRNGATARRLAPMAYQRIYQNSVVLPNGQVVIVGGSTTGQQFTDAGAVLPAELWDPASETFTTLPAMQVARGYHGVALLLPDARVLSAGSGLCGDGCAGNHPDMQILTPAYLLNSDGTLATRPAITTVPTQFVRGTRVEVSTDSPVSAFSMVRVSSTTHTVNNDQRRLSLQFEQIGSNRYAVTVPDNAGYALPGSWMLFAMDAAGTPSVAKFVNVTGQGAPSIGIVDDVQALAGQAVSVVPTATPPAGQAIVQWSARGLPPGLAVDPASGRVSGVLQQTGRHAITLTARTALASVSTEFVVEAIGQGAARYVRLEILSTENGLASAQLSEFELVDVARAPLPRNGWVASASSAAAGHAAAMAIDGNASTMWRTPAGGPALPHSFVVDMGRIQTVGGFRVTPRADSPDGRIANYRVRLSLDGATWTDPVAEGNLATMGNGANPKTVMFWEWAHGRAARQSSTYLSGEASRAVDGGTSMNWSDGSDTSVAHTLGEASPWWQVDLGAERSIKRVRIWNRADALQERLDDVHVFASATDLTGRSFESLMADPTVARAILRGAAGSLITLPLVAPNARYVRVHRPAAAGCCVLQMAELEVSSINRAPLLGHPGRDMVQLGEPVSVALPITDPDGDALSVAATGLPPGLSLNATSGVISGTATAAGVYTIAATVTDSLGAATSTAFSFAVLAPQPVIAPIAARIGTAGTATSFSIEAQGQGLTYAWNFGDGTATTAYSASNSASYTYAIPGTYDVSVFVRTLEGQVTARSFVRSVTLPVAAGTPLASSALVWEARTVGDRLWSVNPDANTVAVIDKDSGQRVAEVTVGAAPRTLAIAPNGEVWVVNREASTLSVISPTTLTVTRTLQLPPNTLPFGIVFGNDGRAYVALEAGGGVLRVEPNGTISGRLSTGGSPRHLARSADGRRLLVSSFITPPLPGESTANVGTSGGGQVFRVDLTTFAQEGSTALAHSERADTEAQGRGFPNYLGAPVFSPDGRSAWVPSKQDNLRRGALRDGRPLDFQNTVRAISSRIDTATWGEELAARIDHDNASMASAAAFHPSGAYLFVALETSRQVAVVDPYRRRELFRLEVGLAPQSVVVSPDGMRLYVGNLMSRNLSFFDLSPLMLNGQLSALTGPIIGTQGTERLAANVLRGKQLFYDARDPRLARDAYMSCASCHNEGGGDGRVWDLTGFGEGLRNTINLRGKGGMAHGLLHWSGNFDEVQDFERQIRDLAGGTGLLSDATYNAGTRNQPLGDAKRGLSADLDALAAYVGSLDAVDPSPQRNADGTLTAQAVAGKAVFAAANCANCHGGTNFTLSNNASGLQNIGTVKPGSGTRLGAALTGIDVPTLRGVWGTGPYLHDGSALTLAAAVQAHAGITVAATDMANLVAYLGQIDAAEPGPNAGSLPANGVYRLVAAHSGQVLDVSGVNTANSAPTVQWPWNGGNHQRWQLTAMGGGVYSLTAVHSGLLLEVRDCSTSDGAIVQQYQSSSAPDCQSWRVEPLGDGTYRLVNVRSGKVLDVSGASTTNGAAIHQWTWLNGANQRWRLERQ